MSVSDRCVSVRLIAFAWIIGHNIEYWYRRIHTRHDERRFCEASLNENPTAMKLTLPLAVVALAIGISSASAQDKKPTQAAIQFFESKVRPVLAQHCFECHGEKRERGGLRLD